MFSGLNESVEVLKGVYTVVNFPPAEIQPWGLLYDRILVKTCVKADSDRGSIVQFRCSS